MKIFLDTADTNIIKEYFETGLVDGVTTNPSLILKSGRNPEEVYQEIKDIGVKDISMEVMGTAAEMLLEGRRLSRKFGEVATIKVPCTRDGLLVCSKTDQSGSPLINSLSHHTVPASKAVFSVWDIDGIAERILFKT